MILVEINEDQLGVTCINNCPATLGRGWNVYIWGRALALCLLGVHLWTEVLSLNKMKISYHSDTDSLYIDFSRGPAAESEEVRDGVVIDLDKNGNITGIDIQHASKKLDLTSLEMSAMPIQITKLVA